MSASFNANEQRIIKALYRLSRFASTSEVAKWAENMSWNTALGLLHNLNIRGVVKGKQVGNRIYWRLNL
ncbi:hypothetical protein HZB02_07540 [Candidatus Woesearchaeota archaeon]|nr:hypothetical protein [Candidatus Woesearchaeota archaeon]